MKGKIDVIRQLPESGKKQKSLVSLALLYCCVFPCEELCVEMVALPYCVTVRHKISLYCSSVTISANTVH